MKIKRFNESKYEDGELKDLPKDIAWKLFKSDTNKHKIYLDIVKALNLDDGVNDLILTKIHNELERHLNKRGISTDVFVMPKEYTKGLTDDDKQDIIDFIEEVFKMEEEYHKKLRKLTNHFLDKK